MGELAEDSLYEDDRIFKLQKPKHKLFEVKVVKRDTMEVFWKTTMVAKTPKECQSIFRKDYSHIRNQYNHSFALLCTQIK